MEFTEQNIEKIKHTLMSAIAHFTSDVKSISIEPKKSFNGTAYLDIATNDIRMTPCVFKSLFISGEAKVYQDEDGSEGLWVRLLWCWKHFNGGSNGTEFATVWMRQDAFGRYLIKSIRFQ